MGTDQVSPGSQELLDPLGTCGLRVDPYLRLRSGGTDQQPGSVRERGLESVDRVDPLDGRPGHLVVNGVLQCAEDLGLAVVGAIDADAVLVDLTVGLEEVVDACVERALARSGGHQQREEDAVLVAEVCGDAKAAALLAAGERVILGHRLGDPLEADRRLVDGLTVCGGDPVHETGGRNGPDDVASPLFQQELVEDREEDVRVEKAPFRGDDPQPVGVAVVDDSEVRFPGGDPPDQLFGPFGDRFRCGAAEVGVAVTPQAGHVRARPREQAVGHAAAAAVHRVVAHRQPRQVRPGKVQGVLDVGADHVDVGSGAGLVLRNRRRVVGDGGQPALDVLSDRGQCGRTVGRNELHAVVLGGVVRGRYHEATDTLPCDGPGERRRRAVPVGEADVAAGRRQHLGEGFSELPGALAGVVADRHWPRPGLVVEVGSDRPADQPDARRRELLAGGPPAVRPEADRVDVVHARRWAGTSLKDCQAGEVPSG